MAASDGICYSPCSRNFDREVEEWAASHLRRATQRRHATLLFSLRRTAVEDDLLWGPDGDLFIESLDTGSAEDLLLDTAWCEGGAVLDYGPTRPTCVRW